MTARNGRSNPGDGDQPKREEVVDPSFSSERVVLDGKHFEDCTLAKMPLP